MILDKLRPGCWLDRPVYPNVQTGKAGPKYRKRARAKGPKAAARQEACRHDDQADNLIKVHFTFPKRRAGASGEFLWARRHQPRHGQDRKHPVHDLETSPWRSRADRRAWRGHGRAGACRPHPILRYYADEQTATTEEITERFASLRERLSRYDIDVEGMFPGICSISVPNDIDDEQLAILADQLDAELVVHDDR